MTTDAERFASHVNVTDTCHLWTGATDNDGYGRFKLNGKVVFAHVYAYGDVPPGHELDHRCHNLDLACPDDNTCPHRRCTNKAHLEGVTHAVNLQRRHDRARAIATLNASSDRPVNAAEVSVYDAESSVSSDSDNARIRTRGRPFAPGNKFGKGRPRKGESLIELTTRAMDHRPAKGRATPREEAALAWAQTMAQRDSSGNRARADWNAYESGLPRQTFVHLTSDDPLASLYAGIEAAGGMRALPPGANASDITSAADAQG